MGSLWLSLLFICRAPKGYILQSHHPSPDFCSIPNPYGFYEHPTSPLYWHFGILPPPLCFEIQKIPGLQITQILHPKKPIGDRPLPFGLNHGTICILRITKFAANKQQIKRENAWGGGGYSLQPTLGRDEWLSWFETHPDKDNKFEINILKYIT